MPYRIPADQAAHIATGAEIWVVVIDQQLAPFTGIRGAETFFEPLQLHLQPPDLLEQLAGSIEPLPRPLAHLNWLTATDCLHGHPGLELGTVGAAPAHRWEPHSGGVPRLRGERWGLSRKARPPQKGEPFGEKAHTGEVPAARLMGLTQSKTGAEVLRCAELTADQISTMQTAASPRDAALLALLSVTTLGIGEATTLTWEDIEGCSEELPDGRAKTSALRRFALPPTACKVLKEWREVCPTTQRGWVFPGIGGQSMSIKSARQIIFAMAEKAGIKVMSIDCFGDHLPIPKDTPWILAVVSGDFEDFFYR